MKVIIVHTEDDLRQYLDVACCFWLFNQRISLQFVPPTNVCVLDTFGSISCTVNKALGKV